MALATKVRELEDPIVRGGALAWGIHSFGLEKVVEALGAPDEDERVWAAMVQPDLAERLRVPQGLATLGGALLANDWEDSPEGTLAQLVTCAQEHESCKPLVTRVLSHLAQYGEPAIRARLIYALRGQVWAIPLMGRLAHDPGDLLPVVAIDNLAHLAKRDHEAVVAALSEAMSDPREWVRDAALQALEGMTGDPGAAPGSGAGAWRV